MGKNCDCYHIESKNRYTYHPITGKPIKDNIIVGVCWGTQEIEECSCDGDRTKCDFYPEVRERAKKESNKVRTGYEAVFPDGKVVFVDSQDKDDVYYLFHVYICDPNVRIYVCWNDDSKKEIVLI